jgi:capsular polysaccharide export protein
VTESDVHSPVDKRGTPVRTFLFLQGLASPFFVELARGLAARGHRVLRINLCLGDALFWNLPATNYRGSLADWRSYLTAFLTEHDVTDLVLFGDCRPYHRVAISLSAHRRVQVHVFEEGYFRPNWVTVERGGVNGNSALPRDADGILAQAAGLVLRPEETFAGSFVRRAVWDVAYNLALVAGRPLFPRYRRHRPQHVLVEYAGWLRRIMRRRKLDRHADREVVRATQLPGGFYLVPLQLDSDYQVRVHSRFTGLGEFINEVCASFALAAPPEAELLLKIHPLDNGLADHFAAISAIAARHGLSERVRCIDGGHLPTLLGKTRGVVVINSTVGTTSLEVGLPTIALGNAIYNLPGLTFQGGLDQFWTEGRAPDPDLFAAFRRLVISRTQINGGYFCKPGVTMAVAAAANRLESVEPMLLGFASHVQQRPIGGLMSGTQPAE